MHLSNLVLSTQASAASYSQIRPWRKEETRLQSQASPLLHTEPDFPLTTILHVLFITALKVATLDIKTSLALCPLSEHIQQSTQLPRTTQMEEKKMPTLWILSLLQLFSWERYLVPFSVNLNLVLKDKSFMKSRREWEREVVLRDHY